MIYLRAVSLVPGTSQLDVKIGSCPFVAALSVVPEVVASTSPGNSLEVPSQTYESETLEMEANPMY